MTTDDCRKNRDKRTSECSNLTEGSYGIRDLVDIEYLRRILEQFTAATGFTAGLVAEPDQEIVVATGWREICTNFHRACPESEKYCKQSNRILTRQLKQLKELNIEPCRMGLIDGATPIIVEGKHVASLYGGQVFFEKPDIARFREQAKEFGYDLDAYLDAMGRVPVVDKEQFRKILSFLSEMAVMIAELGLSNLKTKENTRNLERQIAERRRTEEALRESEVRFRTIVQSSPMGMHMYELKSDNKLVFVDANPAADELLGVDNSQFIGKTIEEAFPPLSETEVPDKYRLAAKRGEPWNTENIAYEDGQIKGAYQVHAFQTSPRNMVAMFLDITEKKKAEETIRQSEERFRALTEKGSDLVLIVDKNNVVTYSSPSIRMFGYRIEEIVGKSPADFIHPDDLASVEKSLKLSAKRPGRTVRMNDFRSRHKDGSWFIIEGFLTCLFDQPGVNGIVFNGREVTEKRRLQDCASRAQRLETSGLIAGQVAHDFNNLLGPLVAYPDFIKDELPENHPAVQYVQDMKEAAEQMSEINQQLLTLGRQGHYNQEPLNLNETITQVLDQICPVPETLIIEKELEEDLMNIRGGGSQIFRAVSNLISNAREAMQDIGQLTVRTENSYVDVSSGRFADVQKGEYVRLTISDTGIGIAPDILPRIFDPFFTTKTSGRKRGSGLGLSVVHAVIEDHDGCIDYESVPGVGTSFYLYFPTTRENTGTNRQNEIVGGKERILVVDDDKVQREVNSRLLDRLGYDVNVVKSGEEALDILREHPQDLLILDMIMPDGIDGTETLRRALEINPSQKAIIVSGFAENQRVQEALLLGASEFIRKPLTFKTIAQAVRRVLDPKTEVPAGGVSRDGAVV
jgi:two-component system cell cycle sensor histidine kinase/response regulator CckA